MDESAEQARDALERLLLGGPRRWTRGDVAERAGMAPERTRRLWRALGFPDAAPDDVVFTDADVHALGLLSSLIDAGFVDERTEASVARALAQALSRLADWQADLLAEVLTRDTGSGGIDPEQAVASTQRVLPVLRAVQDFVWRRHLAANAERLLAGPASPDGGVDLAVGFADLVGYTTISRGMAARELGAMVEDFEAIAAAVIARGGGRVVKTVGDGVLFTAVAPAAAGEIALALIEAWNAGDRPPLRVGAAFGPVLTRLGDVYSPVVNLASRLTSVARPGAVVVDGELAAALRDSAEFAVRALAPTSVRGYEDLRPWLVRRAGAGDAG